MNLTAFKETLRILWNNVNPLYRNPIVNYVDPDHLKEGRRQLPNPQVTQKFIRSILANSRDMKDALRDYYVDEYLIETALVGNALKAIVYRIEDFDPEHAQDQIYNNDWIADRMPCFTLKVSHGKASIMELQSDAMGCYYNSLEPVQCLTLPLTEAQLFSLGIQKLVHHP